MPKTLRKDLLKWYDAHQRPLPWRLVKSPWRTLVSEFMLQQTQVTTALPYFARFVKDYDTPQALAKASETDVLASWSGLGYYRRAKMLHATAKILSETYAGNVPKTANELLDLPGIGRYTANAIASICYHEPVAVLDGNVKRVLSRLFAIEDNIKSPATSKKLQMLAGEILAKHRPGDFNQAVMELGALICRPKNPNCLSCPIETHCKARLRGIENRIPFIEKRKRTIALNGTAAVITCGEAILVRQDNPPPICQQGLFDVPICWQTEPEAIQASLQQLGYANLEYLKDLGAIKHGITHHRISLRIIVFHSTVQPNLPKHQWMKTTDYMAISAVTKKVLRVYSESLLAQLRDTHKHRQPYQKNETV